MLFNSLEFAAFFLPVFLIYGALSWRAQNRWLLLASYVFYGAWDWRFLGLILLSTVVDYGVGIRLAKTENPRKRRHLLGLSIFTNLGILATFKYAGFFADSLSRLLAPSGVSLGPFTLEVVLPVGISFYTFQTLGYTVDVYRRRLEPEHNCFDFALFVAFFPQLVAGPIERAARLLPQITRARRIDLPGLTAGAWLVLWGLFKKVVIADNVAALVEAVYAPGAIPEGGDVLIATYAFAVQIYCDFSGYSDIARGIGRILGFELMLNFRLPYLARNPSDFWRRWHISLSTWLRDYLYIPLGGNRRGGARTYRNLLLTMLLGGLWHGAGWTFVLWGAYHGALLAAFRAARGSLARLAPARAAGARLWRAAAIFLTFHLVCLGWLLFRAESLTQAAYLITRLLGSWKIGLAPESVAAFLILVAPLVVMQAVQSSSADLAVVRRWPAVLQAAVIAALGLGIVILGEDFGQPFIYFQF